ncbi:hypothetical protein COT95_01065, partial [Candidatus Falkowbacteria bacterium CG10_big_fil_rev_8_21_14_0_10_37_6]
MFYVVFFALLFILFTIALAAWTFAPWVPMRKRDLQRVFALASLKPGEIFYDLGCGDGRVVVYAAKNFNARSIGIEMALPLFWLCELRRVFAGSKNIIFKWKDLFKEDLSNADVVYFFGVPQSIKNKLRQKLERELKPG